MLCVIRLTKRKRPGRSRRIFDITARLSIYGAMAIFPRPSSPRAAWRDLRDAVTAPRKHKIVFAALSLALPAGIILAMTTQAKVDEDWIPPTIVYVKQWPATRTASEARAQQAKDLPAEMRAKKERDAQAEATRQAYRRLADSLGIDVDKQRK
jgi:hypothetical protein